MKEIANISSPKISILGPLERKDIFTIYSSSHILILLSKSEGFPKVIAEGAAYGVVPIVSNVGGIKDYINQENGILINDISAKKMIIFNEDIEYLEDKYNIAYNLNFIS